MSSDQRLDLVQLLREADPATRREFLKRAALAGLSMPAFGALLAACGGPPASPAAPTAAGGTSGAAPAQATRVATIPTPMVASPSPAASTGAASAPPAGRKPKQGGLFVTTGHQDVTSLSPDDGSPTVLYVCIANIHEALLNVDENYQIVGRLAESYQVSPDGKTWTFKLRQGVKWHDGQPFTSADVKYNFDFIMDPANAAIRAPLFAEVDKVEAPDPMTVVVTLKQPSAPFAANTA